MKHALEFALFIFAAMPLVVLPLGISRKAGELLGLVLFYLWGSRRKIAIANLTRAIERGGIQVSQPPAVVIRRNFMNMGRYIAEIVKVFFGLGDSIVKGIEFEGMEHYESVRAEGRGAIMVTGHCGNWELLALACSLRLHHVHGIVRKQSNPYMDRFIVRSRERFGTRAIYKEGALKAMIKLLKDGGTMGILADQGVLPDEGVLVDFLGSPAWTIRTTAALARRTGAAVLPGFIYSTADGGYKVKIFPEVAMTGDDLADTQNITSYVTDYIKENPTEWLWIHRRWKNT